MLEILFVKFNVTFCKLSLKIRHLKCCVWNGFLRTYYELYQTFYWFSIIFIFIYPCRPKVVNGATPVVPKPMFDIDIDLTPVHMEEPDESISEFAKQIRAKKNEIKVLKAESAKKHKAPQKPPRHNTEFPPTYEEFVAAKKDGVSNSEKMTERYTSILPAVALHGALTSYDVTSILLVIQRLGLRRRIE